MVYEVGKSLIPVKWDARNPDALHLITLAPEELTQWQLKLGLSTHTVAECGFITQCKLEAHGDFLFGAIAVPNLQALAKEEEAFAFYLLPRLLLLVDKTLKTQQRLWELSCRRSWEGAAPVQILCDILEDRVESHPQYLDRLEKEINQLEEALLNGSLKEISHPMLKLRKQLLYLFSFYDQMAGMGEDLAEEEFCLSQRNAMTRVKLFTARMQRFSSRVQTMREYSMQVWEVYQSQVDIGQNRIMRLLTVVTTLFMPLTLITGWYGMNFTGMSELHWKFGYPMIILVSILVVLLCLWIFKRKKIL